MLLHFGYLFPVIDTQAQSVKVNIKIILNIRPLCKYLLRFQDDNTLYRVQLPYFWPSHVPQADNVEYGNPFRWIDNLICHF